MSIKPVAWMRTGAEKSDGPFGHYGPVKIYSDDAPLYAIPDTHRVVSVELLRNTLESIPWELRDSETSLAIRAIIEDKP